MSATAETSKRWQIKGTVEGRSFAFPVSAFTHSEAESIAETKKPKDGRVESVVLLEKRRFL